MRHVDRADQFLRNVDKAVAPYYWLYAAFGTLCFVAIVTLNTGWMRLLAVVWVIAVPLWIHRYLRYRRTRTAAAVSNSQDQ
ncbi:hypothetical protein [Dactylosporangium sp. NPDC000521]|uniref:hypothetical protein n=1 Tax=Dactylosporangium sp. NPDC000521 TaxID=3363975 RepID=UPI00368A2297